MSISLYSTTVLPSPESRMISALAVQTPSIGTAPIKGGYEGIAYNAEKTSLLLVGGITPAGRR